MRGRSQTQTSMVCLTAMDDFVPREHPIRGVKALVDESLRAMGPEFDRMYAANGRPSIPPERLLKAQLLMALFTVRSERQFCEQLRYNMMFRWFLDMELSESVFDQSTFGKNKARLMEQDVATTWLHATCLQADTAGLLSHDHFTVDGTLIEAWASLKSFKRKDGQNPPSSDDDDKGNPSVDFHGEKRRNSTHESTTDPEAKLYKKSQGTAAKLCFAGHALMENRCGLIVNVKVTEANGYAEREAALEMVEEIPGGHRITVAGDKGYDTRDFIAGCRMVGVTPHVASKVRGSAVDARTTRHDGYRASQRARKRIEEYFGWGKQIGGLRKTRYKGVRRTNFMFQVVAIAYNLLRMTKLMAQAA